METNYLRHHRVSPLCLVNLHLHSNQEITGIETMTTIIDSGGVPALLRQVIDRRREVFREQDQALLPEDAVAEAAVVAAEETTSIVPAGGKHCLVL